MNYFKLKTQWLNNQKTWVCYFSDVGEWIATPYTPANTPLTNVIENIKTLNPSFRFEGISND